MTDGSAMKVQTLLMLSLLALTGAAVPAAAQQSGEVLCPSSGLPVSMDPGCWARENAQAAEQQHQQPPTQPNGYWEKTWGAIAPSPVGGILGTALGASSKEEAERLALEDCKVKGGGACEVEIAITINARSWLLAKPIIDLLAPAQFLKLHNLG